MGCCLLALFSVLLVAFSVTNFSAVHSPALGSLLSVATASLVLPIHLACLLIRRFLAQFLRCRLVMRFEFSARPSFQPPNLLVVLPLQAMVVSYLVWSSFQMDHLNAIVGPPESEGLTSMVEGGPENLVCHLGYYCLLYTSAS